MALIRFSTLAERNAYNLTQAEVESFTWCHVAEDGNFYVATKHGASSSNWSDPFDTADVAAVQAEVDAAEVDIAKIEWAAVRVAVTSNVDLSSPGATLDGVTMATNDRFLATAQSTGAQGGIYVFNGAAAAATRATDADASGDFVTGKKVYVKEGTANAQSVWAFTTTAAFTLGTTTPTFAKLASRSDEILIGPFSVTLAADQSDAATTHGVSGGAFVAPWAGYVVGLSGYLSAAITGAGTTATVEVDVDGAQVAGLTLPFTEAGAEVELTSTLNYGVAAGVVAAGNRVKLIYTSTTITNTPVFVGHVIFAKALS